MTPIRVLFLIDEFSGSDGGTEQHLLFLLNKLPRAQVCPFVAVLYPSAIGVETLAPYSPLLLDARGGWSVLGLVKAVYRLLRYVRKNDIDVVHTFFSTSETTATMARLLGLRRPIVAARRNAGHNHSPLTLLGTRLRNKLISSFLFNSRTVSATLGRIEWIARAKRAVIPNPAPMTRITQGLRESLGKRSLGLDEQTLVVGIVGTIRRVKDHETFIRSARLVLDRVPNTTFIIVGQDDKGDVCRLKELCRELGIAKSVRWLGVLANPVTVMPIFDVAVLSSRSEGLSNTLIEYAAAGIATVATNVGGNPEVVADGENGFLVPPGCREQLADAIVKLLSDTLLRQSFGRAGRLKVARDFDEDAVIGAYADHYQKMLGIKQEEPFESSLMLAPNAEASGAGIRKEYKASV